MPANIILVHDDPKFVEEAAAALVRAGHQVATFQDPHEGLNALETAERFDILITRVRFPPGRPNGVSLAQMAQMRQPRIKVLFTVAPENIEYTEGIGEFVAAPIDIPELVATVARLAEQREAEHPH
jgi:DNA-binding NtrC family response regulator